MGKIVANEVINILSEHMLTDGFLQIVDLEKSHGSWLVDGRDGREYLDLFAMFATLPVGYNHPKVLEAKERIVTASINKPTNSDFYSVQMAEFVDTFFEIAIPDHFRYAFFIEGGALAIENALKASFDWKVKKNFKKGLKREIGSQVIHFEQCFHGRTGYTLSLTDSADLRKTAFFPKFNWPRIVNPKITFPLENDNLEKVLKTETQALAQIKDAIHKYGDDIAALIIEPVQGEGGDNHFRQEFFQKLRDVCDENDIMLIFDEVQSGLGLTGKWWAWEHVDIKPDMMCFGKKSQVCGFVSSDRIDEIEDNVFKESNRLNSTWGGSLADMVRFTVYLEIIRDEDLIEKAGETGKYLINKLYGIQSDYPDIVTNVRGLGLMCAFDLSSEELRDKLKSEILKNGTIVSGSGTCSIRFRPPLNISSEDVDFGIETIRKSLETLHN